MDKNFQDKNKKTTRSNGMDNKKISSSSKEDLLKLKKELEEKKRLLEQKLTEVEKGNKKSDSSPKIKRPRVEIKNRLNTDNEETQLQESKRISSTKSVAKKIKLDVDEETQQKPRVKIKNNLADSTKKAMIDSNSQNAIKSDALLDKEEEQKEKVKISNTYQKSVVSSGYSNEDKNDRPRLRVKNSANNYAYVKKEQVESGINQDNNVIKTTEADNKLFEKTPNVIITNRLDDGESDFHFSDIVEGRYDVNDGEIDLYDEDAEREEVERRENEHRLKIHETKDDYKAFGDDVEGEYGSKLILEKHQRGKLLNKDDEHETDDKKADKSSIVSELNLEVKSLAEEKIERNPLPNTAVNTKSKRVFRHELKYYISWADYKMLSNSLNRLLKHDENADSDSGDYYIRSLYFDDFKNSALTEKLSGIENRKKYRVRIYGLRDDFIRLERKNKTKDYISKDNLTLSRQEYDNIVNGNIEFLLEKKNQLAKDFYYEIKTRRLEPCVIVDYVREAYVHPIKNLRITFDKMVKSGRYDRNIFSKKVSLASVLPPGQVVLEVKFEKGLPDYIIGVLNTISACNRSAISKYALCRKYES